MLHLHNRTKEHTELPRCFSILLWSLNMSENIFVNDPSILISIITFLKIVVFMKKRRKKTIFKQYKEREYYCFRFCMNVCVCGMCLIWLLTLETLFANHFRYPKPLLQNPVNNRNCVKHVLKVRITKFWE